MHLFPPLLSLSFRFNSRKANVIAGLLRRVNFRSDRCALATMSVALVELAKHLGELNRNFSTRSIQRSVHMMTTSSISAVVQQSANPDIYSIIRPFSINIQHII